ncbi:uncharacterized protein N7500_007113 [Penicillium coprophilum]|uniref:uncharacterized protein n=1 Tax=Penicillium coprophilum TaxID=36646 RepID=UPI00238570D8|nr:uncharacterized protein N7500_007113 [Penicillium coprophilum]KAJ5165283.1 hypothetical protein N7500_007113 [Penicillium coprophilum]
MEWARSQAQSTLKSPHLQPHSESGSRDTIFAWRANGFQVEPESGIWNDLLETDYTQEPMTWDSGSVAGSLLDYNSMLLSSMLNDTENSQKKPQAEIPGKSTSTGSIPDLMPPYLPNSSDTSPQSLSDFELDPMYHQMWLAPQTSLVYTNLGSVPSESPRRQNDSPWTSLNQQPSHWNSSQRSLSPFSIDQQMINTSNCSLASANLLQIYNDVLEHNLSCWLNDMTCPYEPGSRDTPRLVPEWGSSRSNMIYQRTIRLDRVAQSCKLLQLTRAEDQAASRALHLAMMAFATQWAQGSRRHRENYPARLLDDGEEDTDHGIAEEFDRILQHHLWDLAHRALQQVSDLESYRVACAELIFGLIQQPWNTSNGSPRDRTQDHGRKFAIDAVLSTINQIMDKEGPPIYMERAARKMHALKYRSDTLKKGLSKLHGSRETGNQGIEALSSDDRGTIGLLYWLAIMSDTLSSSMNERPVVVLDQDCDHEGQKDIQKAGLMDTPAGRTRWNPELFLQGNFKEMRQTHWPCSYEAAAEDIIKSAPVKVLFFRHLSYIQNAIRKSASEDQIEEILHMTTLLYEYWNRTHGAFFSELVQNYRDVPQRIQGWFLCISAHWHLAALMLADLLDFIDENSLGMEDATHIRLTSQAAKKMRIHSARELSHLARVGTMPINNGNSRVVPQMPEFHHAVNEGTLLTEPWTMILIRAFAKACLVFLGELDESFHYSGTTLGHNGHELEQNMDQAENCIKGLWLLGKKSDMAREIAGALSLALKEIRNGCAI